MQLEFFENQIHVLYRFQIHVKFGNTKESDLDRRNNPEFECIESRAIIIRCKISNDHDVVRSALSGVSPILTTLTQIARFVSDSLVTRLKVAPQFHS